MQKVWWRKKRSGVCPEVIKLNTPFRQLLLQTEQDAGKNIPEMM